MRTVRHVAAKPPIRAMHISEQPQIGDLYRSRSRLFGGCMMLIECVENAHGGKKRGWRMQRAYEKTHGRWGTYGRIMTITEMGLLNRYKRVAI